MARKQNQIVQLKSCTYYVLAPLPHRDRAQCQLDKFSYIQKEGCKGKLLSEENHKDLMKLGQNLINRLQQKDSRDVHPKVLTFADVNILSNLNSYDVLYITAHGCPDAIGTEGPGIDLPPKKLAEVLKELPLSHSLTTIKIMACDSAIDKENIDVYGNSDRVARISDQEKESYVKEFHKEMKDYFCLDVIGYLGEVADSKHVRASSCLHTYSMFSGEGNLLIRASGTTITCLSQNSRRDPYEIDEKNDSHVELLRNVIK